MFINISRHFPPFFFLFENRKGDKKRSSNKIKRKERIKFLCFNICSQFDCSFYFGFLFFYIFSSIFIFFLILTKLLFERQKGHVIIQIFSCWERWGNANIRCRLWPVMIIYYFLMLSFSHLFLLFLFFVCVCAWLLFCCYTSWRCVRLH